MPPSKYGTTFSQPSGASRTYGTTEVSNAVASPNKPPTSGSTAHEKSMCPRARKSSMQSAPSKRQRQPTDASTRSLGSWAPSASPEYPRIAAGPLPIGPATAGGDSATRAIHARAREAKRANDRVLSGRTADSQIRPCSVAFAASAAAGSEPQAPGAKAAEAAAPASDAPQLRFEPFQDDAFIAARKSGAPVVLYFEADWCAPCREMHARTFPAPQVLSASSGIRFFRVDMTKPNRYLALVQESFQIL